MSSGARFGCLPGPREFRAHTQTLRNMLACWAHRFTGPIGFAPSGNFWGFLRVIIKDGGWRKLVGTEGRSCKPMNTWQKIGIGAGVAAVLAGGTWLAVWQINKGVVTVQTAPAVRQDLTSVVTASGEVKPLTYTNVLG